jgi:hypothetical protein
MRSSPSPRLTRRSTSPQLGDRTGRLPVCRWPPRRSAGDQPRSAVELGSVVRRWDDAELGEVVVAELEGEVAQERVVPVWIALPSSGGRAGARAATAIRMDRRGQHVSHPGAERRQVGMVVPPVPAWPKHARKMHGYALPRERAIDTDSSGSFPLGGSTGWPADDQPTSRWSSRWCPGGRQPSS